MNEIAIDSWRDREVVYDRRRYKAEQSFAEAIRSHAANWDGRDYLMKDIADYATDIELTALQITALQTALTHPVSIITGGPGTGKTTILRY
jgi:exodeoxyribonuclease V alpha subunit